MGVPLRWETRTAAILVFKFPVSAVAVAVKRGGGASRQPESPAAGLAPVARSTSNP
jgi:hypothetical protein